MDYGIEGKGMETKTQRWCMICKKYTMFKYNRIIGHSECKECGCRASRKEKPEKEQLIMEAYERMCDK